VELDLQNVSPLPIAVDAGPSDLRWELLRDEVAVGPEYGRTEILSGGGR
jgi:hypothetical protein